MEWINIEKEEPTVIDVRISLRDGSELNVWTQSDGDFWSEYLKIFIDKSKVIAWFDIEKHKESVRLDEVKRQKEAKGWEDFREGAYNAWKAKNPDS